MYYPSPPVRSWSQPESGVAFVLCVSGVTIGPDFSAGTCPFGPGTGVLSPPLGAEVVFAPVGLVRPRTAPPPPVKGNALFLFAIFTLPFFELIVFDRVEHFSFDDGPFD